MLFLRSRQLEKALAVASDPRKIQRPGSRGGKYWIDKQGMVRYGQKPMERQPVQQEPEGQPRQPGPQAPQGGGIRQFMATGTAQQQPQPAQPQPQEPQSVVAEKQQAGQPQAEPVKQWVEKAPGLPEDTQQFWKEKGGGDYPAERKALHEQWITEALNVEGPRPSEQKTVFLMAGGPAAGKSTILKSLLNDEARRRMVVVDPDGIKEKIPEYQQAVAANARNAAAMAHEESSDVAGEIRRRAIEAGKHVLLDGTLKNHKKYKKLIQEFKEKGYSCRIIMVDIDAPSAIQFAQKRAERTGRWVPLEILESAYPAVRESFLELHEIVDDFQVYDRRGGQTKLVWDKSGGVRDANAVKMIFGERGMKYVNSNGSSGAAGAGATSTDTTAGAATESTAKSIREYLGEHRGVLHKAVPGGHIRRGPRTATVLWHSRDTEIRPSDHFGGEGRVSAAGRRRDQIEKSLPVLEGLYLATGRRMI